MEYSFMNVVFVAVVLFLTFAFGHYRGWKAAKQNVKKEIAEIISRIPQTKRMNVKVTKVDGKFQIHKQDDNSYITTADSFEDARAKLEVMYPDTNIFVSKGNAEEEGFV